MFIANGPDFYWSSSDVEQHALGTKNSIEEWQRLSFTPEQGEELFAYADEIRLILYLTSLDPPSIEVARRVKSPMVNLNSDDLNNPILLKLAASLGVPVTLHDINASLAEVEGAVRLLQDHGCPGIIVLHSTMESGNEAILYSTANLRVMNTYRSAFSSQAVRVGCVEHTTSDFLIYAVAALEPVLISKHILIAHEKDTPDDSISVDIQNLAAMVKKVRYVEMSLGGGINVELANEKGEVSAGSHARHKVLVAARDLPAGHRVQPGDLAAKRPGNFGGLHPWKLLQIEGATTTVPIARDTLVDFNMFKGFPATDYKFPLLERRKVKGAEKSRGA